MSEGSQEGRYAESLTKRSSLNLAPEKSEVPSILATIDPLKTGFVEFVPFLSYAAIAMQRKSVQVTNYSRTVGLDRLH
jgi:hypothetical protein